MQQESRRYDYPPLWAVPVLLIAAIIVGMWIALAFGLPGFVVALAGVWWLERKADAYVRSRESGAD